MRRWLVSSSSSAPVISRSSISMPLGSSKVCMIYLLGSGPILEANAELLDGVVRVRALEFVILQDLDPRAVQSPSSRFVAGSVVADEVDIAHVVVGQAADHGVDVHLFLDPLPGGLVGTVLENSFLQGDVLELDPSGHLLVEHGTGGREGHLLELGLGFLALLEERHVEAVYLD